MPLVGHAQGDHRVGEVGVHDRVGAQQLRIRAHPLVEQHAPGVAGGIGEAVGDDRHQRLAGGNNRRVGVKGDGVGDQPVPAGDDQRVILADVVGLSGDRVDVDPAGRHGDRVIGAERGIKALLGGEQDALDVVHPVHIGHRIGIPRLVKIVAGADIVAEVNQVGAIQVGDHQVQIVDELDAGDRVAGRVSPDEGDAQRLGLGVRGEDHLVSAALARGQRLGRALIRHDHRLGRGGYVGQGGGQRGGQVDHTPALGHHRGGDVKVIKVPHRAGAVDQHGLHERGAVGAAQPLLEELLHQGEGARHIRRRHAGA